MKLISKSVVFVLIFFAGCCLFAFFVFCRSSQSEVGPLSVSPNGRYLIKTDGTPFYWFADTEWVLNKHNDEQVRAILDDRAAKGFTVIQIFATHMAWARSWDLTGSWNFDLSWANTDAKNHYPFIDNNVTRLNLYYWQRWSSIIDEIAKRDMIVLMLIGEPARKEGLAQAQSLEECYEYARQLGVFFRDKKNLLISVSQDCPGTYGWGVKGWRAIAEGYADGVNGENSFDHRADYSTTFMTYHPWATSAEWFHTDAWLDANGIQGSRNEGDFINDKLVFDRVNQAYNKTNPVKPVLFLEGSYEAEANKGGSLPPTTPRNVRMQFFYAVFGGSPGFSYGHLDNWKQFENIDYLNSPAVEQLVIAKNFMAAREWWNLRPDTTMIVSGRGNGELSKVALVSMNGDEGLVFYPAVQAAEIALNQLTADDEVEACWFDPRNGHIESVGRFPNTQTVSLTPPADWEDAVLVLKVVRAN